MKKLFASFILWLIGWKITGEKPTDDRLIVAVLHHTSNWDFPLGLLNRWKWGIDIDFAIKSTVFVFPFGYLFKYLGGFPVQRGPSKKKVKFSTQIIEELNRREKFMFNIAPEGTRSKVKRLKSGFYVIAKQTNAKIVLVDFNFSTKTINWDKAHDPLPTFEDELKLMKAFYKDSVGKYPEKSFDFSNV